MIPLYGYGLQLAYLLDMVSSHKNNAPPPAKRYCNNEDEPQNVSNAESTHHFFPFELFVCPLFALGELLLQPLIFLLELCSVDGL